MSKCWLARCVVLALLVSPGRLLLAHGDLDIQIIDVTKEIQKDPKNAELYLRRGELHRAHVDWDRAQADYDYAFALDPKLAVVDFTKGRMFLEANWPWSARIALDRFLTKNPDHTEALITRARTLVKLTNRLAAVQDYTRALVRASEGKPEIYLERAQALAAEGKDHIDDALKGLDEGIQKLGPLVTLQLYAMDLETENKRYDAALTRLEQVMSKSPRKETWLERRGNILRQAGRPDEARASYEAALKAMDTLPPARRYVPAMQELEKRLKDSIQTLSKDRAAK
jgi:tetratricopeptide (TPR) repeat protein